MFFQSDRDDAVSHPRRLTPSLPALWLLNQQQTPGEGWIFSLLMFAVMGLVFYFFLIRPQRKRQLEHQVLLESLRRGDEIVTMGGLWGRVVKIDKDHVILQVNEEGTTVRVLKESVAQKEKSA